MAYQLQMLVECKLERLKIEVHCQECIATLHYPKASKHIPTFNVSKMQIVIFGHWQDLSTKTAKIYIILQLQWRFHFESWGIYRFQKWNTCISLSKSLQRLHYLILVYNLSPLDISSPSQKTSHRLHYIPNDVSYLQL